MDSGDLAATVPAAGARTRPARTTPCCPRRAPRTRAASAPTGCGSSTRSTAPTSSASRAAPTGPCTSRCGTGTAHRRRGQPAGAWHHVRHRPGARAAAARPGREPRLVTSRNRVPVRRGARRERARLRGVPARLGRRQGDGGRARRGRHLRARRRHVPVGLRRAGRRRAGRRAARQPDRRLAARLQRPRPVAAGLPHLPPGARRRRARRAVG